MSQNKQKEIEALEYAIEVLQKKVDKLKGGEVTTQDGGPGKDPIPPDPTHPGS